MTCPAFLLLLAATEFHLSEWAWVIQCKQAPLFLGSDSVQCQKDIEADNFVQKEGPEK